MSDKAKGPLRRACGFIWRSVTALRRGLANLIFIAILAVVVIALVMERELKIEPGSTLLLAPTGEVVQQRSFIDPLARFLDPEALEAETPLQDLIDASPEEVQAVLRPLLGVAGNLNVAADGGVAVDAFGNVYGAEVGCSTTRK